MGAIAVATFAPEPLGEETLLSLALIREIAPEERPQRSVGFDPVVEPVDQGVDRRRAADAGNEIAADEATMCLRMIQESTVLHALLVLYWPAGNRSAARSRGCKRS